MKTVVAELGALVRLQVFRGPRRENGGQGSCVEDAEQPSPAPPRHRRRTGGRVLPFGGQWQWAMEEVPSQRMQQVISCPRNPIWASRVVEWKQAHASRPCSVVSGSGNGARTSKPGGFLRRCCRRPPIARNHVVVVGWNFAGVSSPTQPLAFLQATRSQLGPQIGGLPANDKGPFCHFCRAGDGWSLEFPFHGIA